MRRNRWLFTWGLVCALAGSITALAAGKLPSGWRELRFGASPDAVKKQIARYSTHPDRPWEKTPLTFTLTLDLAGNKLIKADADPAQVQHWMTTDLDDGAGLVRAWFAKGKLFAVLVQGKIDKEDYIKKAAEAYGSEPSRVTLSFVDQTASLSPEPPQPVEVALWRGRGAAAIIFQTSGFGPELLITQDPPPGQPAGGKSKASGTRF